MKKSNAKEKICGLASYAVLTVLTVAACWFFAGRYGVFGANMDWISQHSVFPEYFRQQFYKTGQFFPEYAANIGGGQNIYNFSYYGLYNPIVLIAYLLPFVKMSDYLMAASVICLAVSVCLLYGWLKKRGFSTEIALGVAVLFLLAGPMIYQSCHQIMFVQYMPFLLMTFLGVDRYWEKGKPGLYTLGVFLMILTSFYFSIAGMAAIFLYGWYGYPKGIRKRKLFGFPVPMIVAVLSAGVLLVPTAYAILQRSGSSQSQNLKELLMPNLQLDSSLYGTYSVGLTVILVAVLLGGIVCGSIRERVVSVVCVALLTVPVFAWGFNGMLYVRYKSLIPFLPFFCYLTAVFLNRMKNGEIGRWKGTFIFGGTVGVSLLAIYLQGDGSRAQNYQLILFESAALFFFFLIFQKWKRPFLLLVPALVCLVLINHVVNGKAGNLVQKEDYQEITDSAWQDTVRDALGGETGLYRTEQSGVAKKRKDNVNRIWNMRQWTTSVYSSAYDTEYQNFRNNVFQVEQPFRNGLMQSASANPLFQKFMGVKYVIGRSEDGENFTTEVQETAAPVIYGTSQILSEKTYQTMEFPYNQTMLMQYAVTDEENIAEHGVTKTKGIQETNVTFTAKHGVTKEDDSWKIRTKKNQKATLSLDEDTSGKERILYLQFDVENEHPNRDVSIVINGIRNKLTAKSHLYYNGNTTFTYVMKLSADQKKVNVTLGKGTYRICNLKSYVSDTTVLEDDSLYQSTFTPDWNATKGNQISGSIEMEQDGYLITSIPYDSHLEIKVDGREVVTEKVNTAFVGCRMVSGEHWVTITYHAPGISAGKWISLLGVFLWGVMCFLTGKCRKAEKETDEEVAEYASGVNKVL